MRYSEFVESDIAALKTSVANKIKDLPEKPEVEKALGEIEEVLVYVNAGGKIASINGELMTIPDSTVKKAHNLLAKYILSIQMTPKQREEMFELWRADKLVKIDKLLSGKHVPFSDVFADYSTNPGISQLVNDLSKIAFMGEGKGEFLLSVLSKSINKMSKGDLKIEDKAVELKTVDTDAGRFTDQEVKPTAAYSSNCENFYSKYEQYVPKLAMSGFRLQDLCEISQQVPDKNQYKKDLTDIFESLFPDQDIDNLIKLVMNNEVNPAKQEYAQVNLSFYINAKQDAEALDGVLYIDLNKKDMIYFSSVDDLTKEGFRLHAGTMYPVTRQIRNCYPQMKITPTKQGNPNIAAPPTSNVDDTSVNDKPTVKTKPTTKKVELPLGRAKKK